MIFDKEMLTEGGLKILQTGYKMYFQILHIPFLWFLVSHPRILIILIYLDTQTRVCLSRITQSFSSTQDVKVYIENS